MECDLELSALPAFVAQPSHCARGDGTRAAACEHREQEDEKSTGLEAHSRVALILSI